MTRRTMAPDSDDVAPDDEGDDGTDTVCFGYRGQQFEVELDAAQQHALDAVLRRYIAAGRVTV
ncbi:Lsr2 dimerization domain-containing protein [Serinibacter arcticus]|nr:Lsr2 family protein [Serinibacter arcticus]